MTFTEAFADLGLVQVSVQTRTGSNRAGDVFASPVPDIVLAQGDRKVVRDATGKEVVSEVTLKGDPASAPLYPPGSLVTVGGRTAVVISSGLHAIDDEDVDHVRVQLT